MRLVARRTLLARHLDILDRRASASQLCTITSSHFGKRGPTTQPFEETDRDRRMHIHFSTEPLMACSKPFSEHDDALTEAGLAAFRISRAMIRR